MISGSQGLAEDPWGLEEETRIEAEGERGPER